MTLNEENKPQAFDLADNKTVLNGVPPLGCGMGCGGMPLMGEMHCGGMGCGMDGCGCGGCSTTPPQVLMQSTLHCSLVSHDFSSWVREALN